MKAGRPNDLMARGIERNEHNVIRAIRPFEQTLGDQLDGRAVTEFTKAIRDL